MQSALEKANKLYKSSKNVVMNVPEWDGSPRTSERHKALVEWHLSSQITY